jgi:hypothetical protein
VIVARFFVTAGTLAELEDEAREHLRAFAPDVDPGHWSLEIGAEPIAQRADTGAVIGGWRADVRAEVVEP